MATSAYFSGSSDPAARMRVFCFPHGGGGSAPYVGWKAASPPGWQVCPVQLPGRERRIAEKPFDQIDALVADMLPSLAGWLDRPFVLFGHSMGGLIAFELARALRDRGESPAILAVAGSRPPHRRDPANRISHLPDDHFLAELDRRYGGIPAELLRHRELLELMLPMLRADFRLIETYDPTPAEPFAFPLLAFAGRSDQSVQIEHLAGWSVHTTSRSRIIELPGDHFFVKGSGAAILSHIHTELFAHRPMA